MEAPGLKNRAVASGPSGSPKYRLGYLIVSGALLGVGSRVWELLQEDRLNWGSLVSPGTLVRVSAFAIAVPLTSALFFKVGRYLVSR